MNKNINQIEIGDFEIYTKTITESDVSTFAEITGDFNSVHFDSQEIKKTIFKKPIAHGILITGLIATVLGTKLPGSGTITLEQQFLFKKPVYFGDTITAKVKVVEKITDKNLLICETLCYNQNDEKVITGKAVVMPPKEGSF